MQMARSRSGSPPSNARDFVPALLVREADERETPVRILSLRLHRGRMRLLFQCESMAGAGEQMFEVTLVSELDSKPVFSAIAVHSLSGEYQLEAELSPKVAEQWKRSGVNERLDFWLILRPVATGT